ncbi:MAG: hypothetical protein WBA24_13625, partial [Geitlerinemataceae cyanobacterium]
LMTPFSIISGKIRQFSTGARVGDTKSETLPDIAYQSKTHQTIAPTHSHNTRFRVKDSSLKSD